MLTRLRSIMSSLAVALVLQASGAAQTQAPDRPRSEPETKSSSEINKPFQDPDVDAYIKRFESESREVYSRRAEIVKALGLRPGMSVADIGAGTGLFTRMFARRVGPGGKVVAVDISPAFLKHIADEAKKRKQANIQTVQGTQETTNLPPHSIDVAFICDVYHHLEQPKKTLASIHAALRPGGRLVVIEFDRREGVSSDFIMKHVRADKAQFLAEIAAAGFEPIKSPEAPGLKENFFAEFRRLDQKPKAPAPAPAP